MYDPFLLSSSRRAPPRDASIVEISLQRFPYKYRAVVFARRAFSTGIRVDKRSLLFFSLSLFRDFTHEFYSQDHGLDSIKTRLSRDYIYKVTSTFLTGMFAINLRVIKVYVLRVRICALCIVVASFLFPLIHNGSNIQRRYLSISRQHTVIASARNRCLNDTLTFECWAAERHTSCHYDR